jgi:cell division protein FtsQ
MPAATMAQHHYSFPVVTGIDPADPIGSRKARMAVYLRMVADLDQSNQHFSEQISEIDLTDPEDARVLMPEQGDDILAHFGEDKFAERYRRYEEHIAEWRKQYPRLASVDLRYEQQVVLQMKNASTVEEGSGDKAAAAGEKSTAAQPALLKTAAAKTADARTPSGEADSKAKAASTNSAKPKALTAKQKAQKEEAAKEKAIEAKAAQMRAARAKAAAAKQNRNPTPAQADSDKRNEQPMAAQPTAVNLNQQKPATKPHPGQKAMEGQ